MIRFSQITLRRGVKVLLESTDVALNPGDKIGLIGSTYSNVNEAILAAKENAGLNDLILVCGSVFLIAEVQRN